MKPRSDAAADTARRLWARSAGDSPTPEEVAAAAEHICAQLRAGLGRWIGSEGYRALLDRSMVLARANHPALRAITCLGGDEPVTTAAVRAQGTGEVSAGLVALVAAVIELLGRIIGAEMAVRLVEQAGIPMAPAVARTASMGGRDG